MAGLLYIYGTPAWFSIGAHLHLHLQAAGCMALPALAFEPLGPDVGTILLESNWFVWCLVGGILHSTIVATTGVKPLKMLCTGKPMSEGIFACVCFLNERDRGYKTSTC
jgi:hypothetical protein